MAVPLLTGPKRRRLSETSQVSGVDTDIYFNTMRAFAALWGAYRRVWWLYGDSIAVRQQFSRA